MFYQWTQVLPKQPEIPIDKYLSKTTFSALSVTEKKNIFLHEMQLKEIPFIWTVKASWDSKTDNSLFRQINQVSYKKRSFHLNGAFEHKEQFFM